MSLVNRPRLELRSALHLSHFDCNCMAPSQHMRNRKIKFQIKVSITQTKLPADESLISVKHPAISRLTATAHQTLTTERATKRASTIDTSNHCRCHFETWSCHYCCCCLCLSCLQKLHEHSIQNLSPCQLVACFWLWPSTYLSP